MYDILHTRSEPGNGNRHERAVIASGFAYSSDARLTIANWVKQHFPHAEYHRESASWRSMDERGSVHAFFIEHRPSEEEGARSVGRRP